MASSTPLDKANTSFCLDLLKKLSEKDATANVFLSPFSISSALAMVMLGAAGNTATQMSEVLGFTESEQPSEQTTEQPEQPSEEPSEETSEETSEQPPESEEQSSDTPSQTLTRMRMAAMSSQIETRRQMRMRMQTQQPTRLPRYLLKTLKAQDDDVHPKFSKLLKELNKKQAAYVLSVANRLYGEQSYQFHRDYTADTKKYYEAELSSVDFKTSAEEVRVKINDWVKESTQGKIQDLLVQGVVDDMTKLVLVNAIYFKGKWNQQFKEGDTQDAEFKINKNDSKPVKMMRQKSKFSVRPIPEVNCKILEMPYEGKELSMFIFLPNEIADDTTGLEKLETELTYDKFVEWTDAEKMENMEVDVSLPRFKMEEKYDLNEVLISMGMVDAFDVGKSDFSGMSPANDLFLSKVVHKAFVDVNEEGTEAAAATGAVVGIRSARIPVPFNADHPFLFFITHPLSNTVLFAGRYCCPV